jgi:hypothetical protein
MVLQNWILPILIGIVSAYLLLSILYNNYPHIRQKFSDIGALIQLQTSRPYYYTNWVPENQSVYNNVVKSYGMQPSDMMVGTRELNQGYPMVYPISYPVAYPEDYPVQYPPVYYNSNSNTNSLLANPHVKINNM